MSLIPRVQLYSLSHHNWGHVLILRLTDGNSQVFGSIDAFDPKIIEWEIYETKFDFYVEANEITDDKKKKALLLASLGMVALS